MIEGVRNQYVAMAGAQMAGDIVKDLTQPQTVFADGKQFTFFLRAERAIFPFSLTLLKATHTFYQGTDTPKDFRSLVQLQNPRTGENRQVEISMNHPMRYAELTFYQYQMNASEAAVQAGQTPSSIPHGRAQSGLVDALHRLRSGRCRAGHSIYVPSGWFHEEEKMSNFLP